MTTHTKQVHPRFGLLRFGSPVVNSARDGRASVRRITAEFCGEAVGGGGCWLRDA